MRKQSIYSNNSEITKLQEKINNLESKNKILKNNLKIEKFPDGAIVYVIEDYDVNNSNTKIYKIGKTDNLNKRIKIYNTHSIHNKKVIHFIEIKFPLQLEICIKSMLYKYRIKNKKEYYECSLDKIKKAFKLCIKSIKCIETEQDGGSIYKITYFENKINKLYHKINIYTLE